MLAHELHQLLALFRRQTPPEIEEREPEADGTGTELAETSHAASLVAAATSVSAVTVPAVIPVSVAALVEGRVARGR